MGYLELIASPEALKHTRSWLPCQVQQALKGADEAKTHQAALLQGTHFCKLLYFKIHLLILPIY